MLASLPILLHTTVVVGLVIRVLLRPRMEPSVRLAWIMVIQAVPLVGIIAYILFGEVRMNQADVQRMADVRDRLTGLYEKIPEEVIDPPDRIAQVAATNQAVGGMVPVSGNRITLLEESDRAIDRLVDAIDHARDHVHILFYIWMPDDSGTKVAEAIMRAARRGVECRVIVDSLGSRLLLRSPLWAQMEEAGAECVRAFPLGLPLISILFRRLDLRNHRKILVVDNRLAITGSRNCANKAFETKARFAPWIDILVSVEGPAVRELQAVFLADWMSYTGRDLGDMLVSVPPVAHPGSIAQVIATGPDFHTGNISDSIVSMLHSARKKVVISTPYYVPDNALEAAVRAVARRGVDVTLILPARNDSLIVGATSQGFYHGLLSAGVRLMLFEQGLNHSKIMTIDGEMAMIGSANLDRRSFELNYEVNMAVFDPEVVADLDAVQQSYIERSRPITLDEVRSWSAWRRLRNNLFALASPLL